MQNLTVGSPLRVIVMFTIPLLIGNIFQQVYLFTDAAVTGRMIGVDGLAAVGDAGGLVFLLIGFSWGATAGLAIPVAKAFGAGDMAGVRRNVAGAAYAALGIAVVITVVGTVFAGDLMRLLHVPTVLTHNAAGYLAVTFAGATVTVAFNFLAAVIRALGDSRTPLVFLILSCVLNAGLVVLFIGAFHLGVPGAALATVVAQSVSVAATLVYVKKRMPVLVLSRADWREGVHHLAEPLRMGLPMGFQMSIIAIGALMLQFAVNGLGPTSVGAFTASQRIDQLAGAPLNSFGIALVTYVAQNRGAAQWARIRAGVRTTAMLSGTLGVLGGLVVLTFARPLVSVFVGGAQPEVHAMAQTYFLINGPLYVVLALLFVVRNAVQGMGVSWVPTVAGALELAMRGVAAFVLVGHLGFAGVAVAAPLAWVGSLAATVPMWIVLRRRLLRWERPSVDDGGAALAIADDGGALLAIADDGGALLAIARNRTRGRFVHRVGASRANATRVIAHVVDHATGLGLHRHLSRSAHTE